MTAGHLREHFTLVEPGHTLLVYQNLETGEFGFFGEDTYITIDGNRLSISELCPGHGDDYADIPDFPINALEMSKYDFLFVTNRFDCGKLMIDSQWYYRPEIILTQVRVNHSNSFLNTLLFSEKTKNNWSTVRMFLHKLYDTDMNKNEKLKKFMKRILSPVC